MAQLSLILGLAAGYHYGDVRPFLLSLRESGFAGRVALFVSPTTRDRERMAAHDAEIIPFERPSALEHVPYNAWRYFLYRDYLATLGALPEQVMLSDVRDVIFQRDPAGFDWPEGLSVFQEDERMSVVDCEHMRRWVGGHLGADALQEMAGRRIVCSGITVGDGAAVARYLEAMTQGLLPFSPGQRMAGYDQGLHNRLLQKEALGQVRVFDNRGPVLTLGYRAEGAELNAEGDMLAEDGAPAVVVHQYDRHPELFAHVRRRWG